MELESKYERKMVQLEDRSKCLDKSLDLLQDMKGKFNHFETVQQNYNDLLYKYNSLLYQTGSARGKDQGSSFETRGGFEPVIAQPMSINTIEYEGQAEQLKSKILQLEQKVQEKDELNSNLREATYQMMVSPHFG